MNQDLIQVLSSIVFTDQPIDFSNLEQVSDRSRLDVVDSLHTLGQRLAVVAPIKSLSLPQLEPRKLLAFPNPSPKKTLQEQSKWSPYRLWKTSTSPKPKPKRQIIDGYPDDEPSGLGRWSRGGIDEDITNSKPEDETHQTYPFCTDALWLQLNLGKRSSGCQFNDPILCLLYDQALLPENTHYPQCTRCDLIFEKGPEGNKIVDDRTLRDLRYLCHSNQNGQQGRYFQQGRYCCFLCYNDHREPNYSSITSITFFDRDTVGS